jgi:protoporphyrinogen oxidase
MMEPWSVAIIGGGPSGLMAAYQLQKRCKYPLEITIYEAGNRLGGKIRTARFSSAPISYEAGAAELYDYSAVGPDPLRELIAELGLSTSPMGGRTIILHGHVLRTAEDVFDKLGAPAWHALQQFDQRAKAWMNPREYYDSDWYEGMPDPLTNESFHSLLAQIPDPAARRYVHTMVHSDLATEPHQTNAAYGMQNYLMNDPAYMQLYTIDGGIERLPEELAKRIRATVLLRQPVTRVERAESDLLRVFSRNAGQIEVDEFDYVIAALPNNWLPAIEWGGELLAQAMHDHHVRYDYPAHYLRVSALFQKPFWRDCIEDSYFMLDAFGGCCLYDESSRNGCETHGVLGWLLGGESALTLSNAADDQIVQAMLDALPDFLQHGRDLYLEGCVHRWVGAVNGLPGGVPARPMEERHVPEPTEHSNLFVMGDYLFDSTLNGVMDSADYVAECVVEEMHEEMLQASHETHGFELS